MLNVSKIYMYVGFSKPITSYKNYIPLHKFICKRVSFINSMTLFLCKIDWNAQVKCQLQTTWVFVCTTICKSCSACLSVPVLPSHILVAAKYLINCDQLTRISYIISLEDMFTCTCMCTCAIVCCFIVVVVVVFPSPGCVWGWLDWPGWIEIPTIP